MLHNTFSKKIVENFWIFFRKIFKYIYEIFKMDLFENFEKNENFDELKKWEKMFENFWFFFCV